MDANVKNFFNATGTQPLQKPYTQAGGPSSQLNYNSLDNGLTPILKDYNSNGNNSINNQYSQMNQYNNDYKNLPEFRDSQINLNGNESRLNNNSALNNMENNSILRNDQNIYKNSMN